MSAAAVHGPGLDMSTGEKALHPFFTRGPVVAKRNDDNTSCEESSSTPIQDQPVNSSTCRQPKRRQPPEDVTSLEQNAQGDERKTNGTLVSQPTSQRKRRKVSKEAHTTGTGGQTGTLSDPGLETMSEPEAAATHISPRTKAPSDPENGSNPSKRKQRKRRARSEETGNMSRGQPYVLVDTTGFDRASYLSENGQEAKLSKRSLCQTQPGSTTTQTSGSIEEDSSLANAESRPSAHSSPGAEARGRETAVNTSDNQIPDNDRTKSSQIAPIFFPKRRSSGSDIHATRPSSVPRSKKRSSGRQAVAQADVLCASSECSDLPKGGKLIVTLRYRRDLKTVLDGPQEEQGQIKTKDIVDLTLENSESSPVSEIAKRSTKPVHPFFLGKTTKQHNPANNRTSHPLKADAYLSEDKQVTSGSDTDRRTGYSSRRPDGTKKPLGFGFSTGFGAAALGRGIPKSVVKFPGAVEAPWPPKDMVHIRGLEAGYSQRRETDSGSPLATTVRSYQQRSNGKQKHAALQIPENEDILHHLARRLDQRIHTHATALAEAETDGQKPQPPSALRLPERIVLTGSALKIHLRHELRSPIYAIDRDSTGVSGDDPQEFKSYATERHPGLLKLYRSVAGSFTPFDLFSYETQQWSTKYAPSSAEDVLQPGREAMVLRDWLRHVALSPADIGRSNSKRARGPSTTEKQSGAAHQQKRRKRKRPAGELCDFIVPTDDESDGMEEVSGPDEEHDYSSMSRSVIKGGAEAFSETGRATTRVTNAMLISGPPGCGKTAAAYAVAKELDFEVFEINPGSRRNGKDLLEKIGDVTINHLVHHSKDSILGDITTGSAIDRGKRKASSMGSFFKPQVNSKPKPAQGSKPGASADTSTQHQTPRVQKQSLILLEEVDVLYEEDKTFWATVLGLLLQSKRPIIMTCNDENLIPVDALPLHGILRFRPPPIDLAVDYLLLLAGAEGHLLRRPAVEALYRSKRRDLRASIMEIDFWCQMAVGDRKGGLEWMHPRCPPWEDSSPDLHALHVASRDTYLPGMGWSSRDVIMEETGDPYAIEKELLGEAWNGWDMDVEDWCSGRDIRNWVDKFTPSTECPSSKMFAACCAFDRFHDYMSSADVFSDHALAADVQIPLDTTQPAIPDHVRGDTVQGYTLIQADPAVEYDTLSIDMSLYTKLVAKQLLFAHRNECDGNTQTHTGSFNEGDFIELVTNKAHHEASSHQITRRDLSAAFDPISEAPNSAPAAPGFWHSSEFDRTFSLIVEDVAPYVRAIVLHDLQLEDQRRQIREQSNKRLRMTRASRSALEGGSRSSVRRDKWFEGDLDEGMVLQTGSQEWYQAAAKSGSG